MDCYRRHALLWFPNEYKKTNKFKHLNTIIFSNMFLLIHTHVFTGVRKSLVMLFVVRFVSRRIWKVQICNFWRPKDL